MYNIKYIRNYINNDYIYYYCEKHNIPRDSLDNFLEFNIKKKNELKEYIVNYFKNKYTLHLLGNNINKKNLINKLKSRVYNVIINPYIMLDNFYFDECILLKESDMYNVLIYTNNTENTIRNKKENQVIVDFIFEALNKEQNIISKVYFLPMQENYMNKENFIEYKQVYKTITEFLHSFENFLSDVENKIPERHISKYEVY